MSETAQKTRTRRITKSKAAPEVAKSYFDAVTAKDPDEMAKHWHKDGIDELVPVGIFRGPDEIRDYFREVFGASTDSVFEVEDMITEGRKVVVRWRMWGTFDGKPFMDIEPTGRRFEIRGADCLEVERGKIVRNTAFYDGAEFARQIGMLPPRDSSGERAMKQAFNAATKLRSAVRERMGR
jgi:predicted ester cyclase